MRDNGTKVKVKGYGYGTIFARTFDETPRYDIQLDRHDGKIVRDITEDQIVSEADHRASVLAYTRQPQAEPEHILDEA